MKDVKHSPILDGLHLIKEAKSPPLVPPNEDNSTPNGKKHGDTIRIIKEIYKDLPKGSFWRCTTVAGDTYSDTMGTKTYSHYVYVRINAITGKQTESTFNKFNMSGFQMLTPEQVNTLFTRGEVQVLTPGLPLTQGEITIEDLKSLMSNLDADKIIGLPLTKLLPRPRNSSDSLDIDFRGATADTLKMDTLFKKILKALDTRGYKYTLIDNWKTVDKALPTKGYTDFIYISKRNGG
jgi:hypothetical protein